MRKLLVSSLLLLGLSSFAENVVNLDGTEFALDTLFHAQVGPGTTQTSLILKNKAVPTQQMRVFYSVIDLKNPLIDIRNVVGQDKLGGGETLTSMATRYSKEKLSYFLGVNTDGFYTSGSTHHGEPLAGEPYSSQIVDGEIYKISNNWTQISFDEKGEPYYGFMDMVGYATVGGKRFDFKRVNTHEIWDTGITVFTHRFYKKLNHPEVAGQVSEVTAKMLKGDCIRVGEEVEFEITTHTGECVIPEGEYVLAATEAACRAELDKLKVGDRVTVHAKTTVEGVPVNVIQTCGGNPRILEAGKKISIDNPLWTQRHPRTGVGYSEDKSKFYMVVIDGRSQISIGATTNEFSDLMKYLGADYANNEDGGGSSTFYTLPLGVRNVTSDGHERGVAAASFVVSKAPTDNKVVGIRFMDWAMKLPKYGIYTPKFYGYNQYGVLVDANLEGVKLSCDSKLGEVINNGTTLYGTGEGCSALTAEYNGVKTTIPVTVVESADAHLRLQNIIIDNVREYPVEVNATVLDKVMPINPVAFSWTSDNVEVATIDANTGILKGIANGSAKITGTKNSLTETMNVKVEIPTATYMPVCYPSFPTDWKLKQTGGKEISIAEFGNGFKLDYTGNGMARGAYISVESPMTVWSLVEGIRIKVNPGEATVKKISMNAENALGERMPSWVFTDKQLEKNKESVFELNLSEWSDVNDIAIYPIKISSIRFDMGVSKKDSKFTIPVPGFEAVYPQMGGVESNTIAKESFCIYPNPVHVGEAFTVMADGLASVEIFALNGAKVLSTIIEGQTSLSIDSLNAGIYLVKVITENSAKTVKLVVK